jgi:hypothetical protein
LYITPSFVSGETEAIVLLYSGSFAASGPCAETIPAAQVKKRLKDATRAEPELVMENLISLLPPVAFQCPRDRLISGITEARPGGIKQS